jgi:hypothetical protein
LALEVLHNVKELVVDARFIAKLQLDLQHPIASALLIPLEIL